MIKEITSLSIHERNEIAAQAEITTDYLYQLGIGYRVASAKLAKKLDEISQGKLPKHVLRPDIFGEAA